MVDYSAIVPDPSAGQFNWVLDFYHISIKRGMQSKLRYGQQHYDFDGGILFFIAPNQLFSIEHNTEDWQQKSGWMLLIHPDFLWNTALAKGISRYDFFDYSVHEALFLSEEEELILNGIVDAIRKEYQGTIDRFTRLIIGTQLETLLNFSARFYARQFMTRKDNHNLLLAQVEQLIAKHFRADNGVTTLPSVQDIAAQLQLSPNYLSRILKTLTGKNTQQFIHDKIMVKAKELLVTTTLSVSEIAYALGFEHPQSFSKFFKGKTKESPLAFRDRFRNIHS